MSDPPSYRPRPPVDVLQQWNEEVPVIYAAAIRLFPEYGNFSVSDFRNNTNLRLEAALRVDHMAWSHGSPELQRENLERAMKLAIGEWDQDERTLLNGPLLFFERYVNGHQDPFKFYASLCFDTGKIETFLKRIRKEQ